MIKKTGSSDNRIFKMLRKRQSFVLKLIGWKFRVFKRQWRIEKRQFVKFKMIEARSQHMHDAFDDFVADSCKILKESAVESVKMIKRRFGIEVSEKWLITIEVLKYESFTIINMDQERIPFWNEVISSMKEPRRATQLVGVQAIIWDEDVGGITFQNKEIGRMLSQQVYLIEEGYFERGIMETKVKVYNLESFRPIILLDAGRMLAVKERFMRYSSTKILASEIGYPR
jgi:hypothetical protein